MHNNPKMSLNRLPALEDAGRIPFCKSSIPIHPLARSFLSRHSGCFIERAPCCFTLGSGAKWLRQSFRLGNKWLSSANRTLPGALIPRAATADLHPKHDQQQCARLWTRLPEQAQVLELPLARVDRRSSLVRILPTSTGHLLAQQLYLPYNLGSGNIS